MSIRSTKGWIRIGIVLSVLWIVAFWSYSVLLYRQATPFQGTWLFKQDQDKSQPVGEQDGHRLVPVKPALRPLPFIAVTFAPIAAGWVFVIAVVYTTAWVSRGFRDDDPQGQAKQENSASGQQVIPADAKKRRG
jgi:hypothetical protein